MTADRASDLKDLIAPLRAALGDHERDAVHAALSGLLAPDCRAQFCHPLNDATGPEEVFAQFFAPLISAFPDLERRDLIVMAGMTDAGADWIGCCGHYMGTFMAPWLDIPPTGHLAAMRYHEFYRVEGTRVVEIQAIWDIPELMMQAGVWPMAPSLGRDWQVPGPATQDGLRIAGDAQAAARSCKLVVDMLTDMSRHPAEGGPEVMRMDRYWHPRMNWYGPAGIGSARGIDGFRRWHQIPFLAAMPDRGQYPDQVTHHFFGEGDYVAVTGWPNMMQTLTGGGWLGLPATGQRITLRSLDFWRIEDGLIRENWVLVDLLDVFDQVGVDVLARMRALGN